MSKASRTTAELPPDYPTRVKKLRAALGLTQVRLAELMGVSLASVNRWEKGQTRPSALAWRQILMAEGEGSGALGSDARSASAVAEASTPYTTSPETPALIDFSADPEVVRVVAEGERLSYGHLFNPGFAVEISQIDPLPHQRIALYEHMLGEPKLRFMLADDAGAGKTIMAGLYIREMLSRRLIRRILVAPPAGLVGNWKREMRALFNLSFRIVSGAEARLGNPFTGPESDLVIAKLDTLAGERMFSRLQEASVQPYDLVIFDEAHKLSAYRDPDGTFRPTDRYRLAEALAGIESGDPRWTLPWRAHHLLLLTATPHMGKDFPYFCLWRLLEPEVLSTPDAFNAYPPEARRRHFLRRTKEEMLRLDGSRIYPSRVSNTLSYDLTQGEVSEQRLYDETTTYIQSYYNRARILNRSAARLAMSIFQRRLASSTYALLRSLQRRLSKLDQLIEDIRQGRLTLDQVAALQRRLDAVRDTFEACTADEEEAEGGLEENELTEDRALGGVVAVSLGELEAERAQVKELVELARRVYDVGEESKFERLREVLTAPDHRGVKILIFTEHRDTLDFLVRKLEGLGYAGQVARIHGGMDYRERDAQVEFFRKPPAGDGATYMVATDAAGEGINLQFCWLMVNYDIPWNPARLEQRMGRVHRYKQLHDPVFIVNLIAARTREGRVLRTLLEKLETIRKELGSDKVFDVIGRLFENVSLREYLEQALTDEAAADACSRIEGKLTKEQVLAQEEWERSIYGRGGDVRSKLAHQREQLKTEELRRLLPGFVRRFIERAAPLLDIGIEGDFEAGFSLRPLKPLALDPLWPALEGYPPERRSRLMVQRPDDPADGVFVHPGEPIFERLRALVSARFWRDALKGGVFIDPYADRPYFFHLAVISVVRKADPGVKALGAEATLLRRLVGLKHDGMGPVEECPIEHLLLLKGVSGVPAGAIRFATAARESRDLSLVHADREIAARLAEEQRAGLISSLPVREEFLSKGFDFQDAELASQRARFGERARAGDARAAAELTKIKARQREVAFRREEALAALRREPDLIGPGEVKILAHALVVPSTDPEDRSRHDREVEALAVRVARAHEAAAGAVVRDVSTPALALAADLTEHPGFDLHSRRPGGEERAIEVKGRAGTGDIELTENEWAKACNLRERYWLYVVFDCARPHPRLLTVRDPFHALLTTAKGGVVISEQELIRRSEGT